MGRFLLGAVLALLLGLATPLACHAADAWLLDTSVPGAPKASVSATLTYLDPATAKQVTVRYTPGVTKVLIERNFDVSDASKHKTSVTITMGTGVSLNLNAGMLGSGLKLKNKTTLTATINPETDTNFPLPGDTFRFNDTSSRSMAAAAVMASSAQGSYTEVVDKSGNPTGPVSLNVTYSVVGNLDVTNIPARITVKVSASNVQPAP